MVRLRRILRDHQEAGAINSLLALWGFVDDTTFLTNARGVVYLRGKTPKADARQRRSLVTTRAALCPLAEHCASTKAWQNRPSSIRCARVPTCNRARSAQRRTETPERATDCFV